MVMLAITVADPQPVTLEILVSTKCSFAYQFFLSLNFVYKCWYEKYQILKNYKKSWGKEM